jgi:hypothetical protein
LSELCRSSSCRGTSHTITRNEENVTRGTTRTWTRRVRYVGYCLTSEAH